MGTAESWRHSCQPTPSMGINPIFCHLNDDYEIIAVTRVLQPHINYLEHVTTPSHVHKRKKERYKKKPPSTYGSFDAFP